MFLKRISKHKGHLQDIKVVLIYFLNYVSGPNDINDEIQYNEI